MASFIMHKTLARSSFTKAALTTLEGITALEQFLLKHKKDCIDANRTTEQERDSIEHEVMVFIKACKDQIDVLKNGVTDEEAKSKGWLGVTSENLNADTIVHKHGVVLILSEKLHLVTSQFDQLRALRFQEAINRATPRRKRKQSGPTTFAANSTGNADMQEINNSEVGKRMVSNPSQLCSSNNCWMTRVELANMLDAVQDTETKVVEMSALNHLMSSHVLQQAQQIDYLYDQAVEATNNVALGNKELSQAIKRNS